MHGPNPDRQEAAHAHFASFSPDNRFAYVNDLGGDMIHIYTFDPETAVLKNAGAYKSAPGAGPRTLHFHPNGTTAYCMNEMKSSVDVLRWNKADGSLTRISTTIFFPRTHRCRIRRMRRRETPAATRSLRRTDALSISRTGEPTFSTASRPILRPGALSPIERTATGGKTPRNFTLDPNENWMLVADQNSNNLAVFPRNATTGKLANEGKTVACPTPMCILFA